jgi:hypothetical protein
MGVSRDLDISREKLSLQDSPPVQEPPAREERDSSERTMGLVIAHRAANLGSPDKSLSSLLCIRDAWRLALRCRYGRDRTPARKGLEAICLMVLYSREKSI